MCFKKKKKKAAAKPEAEVTTEAAAPAAGTLEAELSEDQKRLDEITAAAEAPAKSIEEQQKDLMISAGTAKLGAEKELNKQRSSLLEKQKQREASEAQMRERQRKQRQRQAERERKAAEDRKSKEPSAASQRRRSLRAGRGRRTLLSSAMGGMGFYSRFGNR